MSRTRRLEGLGCLIVGGTGGIGLASARRFLDEGARVVITGRSSEEAGAACLQLSTRGAVQALTGDVTMPSDVDEIFAQALDQLGGRLDVLFHVAGLSGRRFGDGALADCSLEGWEAVMSTNSRGVFLTNRLAVRQMLRQNPDLSGLRGTVLNMGSVLGWSPAPDHFGTCAYAASKGAVQALTITAAARYARDGIRFNLLAPGLIDTPMSARAVSDPAIRDYLVTKQPLRGGPGGPDDCAEAALYLCEPASRFVTGTVFNVDGGWCVSEGQRSSGSTS